MKELIKGLDKEIYAVSESDRYFAWTKDSQNGQSDTMHMHGNYPAEYWTINY